MQRIFDLRNNIIQISDKGPRTKSTQNGFPWIWLKLGKFLDCTKLPKFKPNPLKFKSVKRKTVPNNSAFKLPASSYLKL